MEACSSKSDEPIWRIIGGHNVNYVDEIALVYQKNFSADMRMVSIFLCGSHLCSVDSNKDLRSLPRCTSLLFRFLLKSDGPFV